jgi:hypothetical protein
MMTSSTSEGDCVVLAGAGATTAEASGVAAGMGTNADTGAVTGVETGGSGTGRVAREDETGRET